MVKAASDESEEAPDQNANLSAEPEPETPVVGKQVPFTAKHPSVMFQPLAAVDVPVPKLAARQRTLEGDDVPTKYKSSVSGTNERKMFESGAPYTNAEIPTMVNATRNPIR